MIPYTVQRRGDTKLTNVEMGIWLFLASEAMLFGSLFSAYALLRVSAPTWPSGRDVLNLPLGLINTAILLVVSGAAWRARSASALVAQRFLWLSTIAAIGFLIVKGTEYNGELTGGLYPSASMSLAMYYLLTGVHALHVIGGLIANVWAIVGSKRRIVAEQTVGRVRALSLYWLFVDAVWFLILLVIYLS